MFATRCDIGSETPSERSTDVRRRRAANEKSEASKARISRSRRAESLKGTIAASLLLLQRLLEARRKITNATTLRTLRTLCKPPQRLRRRSASSERTSRSLRSKRLFVGKITASVNGTTARKSSPPISHADPRLSHHEISDTEPTRASGACIN